MSEEREGREKGRESGEHPDLAELEAARTGEGDPEIAWHLEACPECRRRRDELDGLAGELKALWPEAPAPETPAADRAVESFLAGEKAPGRSRVQRLFASRLFQAAAATLFIAAGALMIWRDRERALPGDLDRSGTVDIVDAYLLDRRLRAGDVPLAWDLTGDGRVDETDVRALGRRAVALGPREPEDA